MRRRSLSAGCVRITVSLPADLVRKVKPVLGTQTMSSFVSDAIEAKLNEPRGN
jgi:metal-responsive CopG/Arc/MetJ family transcriptional regulator